MYISDNGVSFIASYESCRLTAYQLDGEQYWTIGYGHYGADVYEGMTITQEQADEYFKQDLQWVCAGVDSVAVSKFPSINQNQYDALCSYTFNRGVGASDNHNGLRQLIHNSDTLEEVANNFVVYWGTAMQYRDALIKRRKKETELFNTPISSTPSTPDQPDQPDQPDYTTVIDSAVEWAVAIANDDVHGYDQTSRWGNDYDCSSLIIQAYEQAGCPVKTNGATYTANMEEYFVKSGFESLQYTASMSLVKGDVLLRDGHTEMYIGNGQNVGAHINENGTITGGQTGDQTGNEISITSFADSGSWDIVLRLHTSFTPNQPDQPDQPDQPVQPTEPSIYDLLLKTRYPTSRLSEEEVTLLKSTYVEDEVKMKHTFNHNKRQVGTNSFGKRLTFDNLLYKIKSVNSNGFLKLSANGNIGIFKTVNPKYIKGAKS